MYDTPSLESVVLNVSILAAHPVAWIYASSLTKARTFRRIGFAMAIVKTRLTMNVTMYSKRTNL